VTDERHRRAMDLVEEAEQLVREGQREAAREKYEEAAKLEQECADTVGDDQPRTRGILRVSAVSAWRMARSPERAAALARRYLTEPISPGFARELHDLLNQIERERAEESAYFPREPEECAEALLEELRRLEADLSRGRVWLTPIRMGRAA
jgi:hypothetical protein